MRMEIRLSPELEAAVERGVASGRYASVEEYIAKAVEVLREREAWREETLEEERVKMAISLAEAERGEVADEQQVRDEMQAMKAEWISQHRAS
jgi:Arc/MetJ-type ribon-helix-helix transcriptional regulator